MPYAQKSETEHSIPHQLSRQDWLCLFREGTISISFTRFKCHLTVAAYKQLSQNDSDISKV